MRSAVGVMVALAISGCAHQFAGTGSQMVGVRAGPVNGVQASLYERGMYGPNVSLQRGATFYRGTVLNRVVNLAWDRGEVRGMVDAAPTQLTWTNEGDGVRIRGLYGGKLSNLKVTTERIEGTIGDCGYSMYADRRGYRGRAMCLGGLNQEAEVTLPADLGARAEGEQVALLALILSGGVERTQREMAFTAEAPWPGVDHYYDPTAPTSPSWVKPRSQ